MLREISHHCDKQQEQDHEKRSDRMLHRYLRRIFSSLARRYRVRLSAQQFILTALARLHTLTTRG